MCASGRPALLFCHCFELLGQVWVSGQAPWLLSLHGRSIGLHLPGFGGLPSLCPRPKATVGTRVWTCDRHHIGTQNKSIMSQISVHEYRKKQFSLQFNYYIICSKEDFGMFVTCGISQCLSTGKANSYYLGNSILHYIIFLLQIQALQLTKPLLLRNLLLYKRFPFRINIFLFSTAFTLWPTEKRPRHQVYPSVAASHSSENRNSVKIPSSLEDGLKRSLQQCMHGMTPVYATWRHVAWQKCPNVNVPTVMVEAPGSENGLCNSTGRYNRRQLAHYYVNILSCCHEMAWWSNTPI